MTARERMLALIEGRAVDRKPTVAWPKDVSADFKTFPAGMFPLDTEGTAFAEAPNVFGRLQQLGQDPIELAKDVSSQSGEALNEADVLTRMESRNALQNGALGVFYRIDGATAGKCTPMEYGGLFLERDRAFLESIADAPCNVLYINGKEPYLDFVSDLPAHVFAWDAKGSGIPVSEVRKIRKGLLAADDPEADITIVAEGSITDILEGMLAHA